MPEPTADRPSLPAGYDDPAAERTLLEWTFVDERLAAAQVFWLATTRPDGRPHVVPRWGVWMDRRLYYDGSPATRHARNLASNPYCSLHLEDGTSAVILEGRAGPSRPPGFSLGARLSARFTEKYAARGYAPAPDAWAGDQAGGLCVFVPTRGLAWTVFPTDATRFRFRPEVGDRS